MSMILYDYECMGLILKPSKSNFKFIKSIKFRLISSTATHKLINKLFFKNIIYQTKALKNLCTFPSNFDF